MREDRVIKLPVFRTMFKPVARKAWKCDICKELVDVGDRYIHYIDRRPHKIINYRFHTECFQTVIAYCALNKRSSFTPITVRNWAKKTFCTRCTKECSMKDCKHLYSAMKVKVREMKRNEKNQIPT